MAIRLIKLAGYRDSFRCNECNYDVICLNELDDKVARLLIVLTIISTHKRLLEAIRLLN